MALTTKCRLTLGSDLSMFENNWVPNYVVQSLLFLFTKSHLITVACDIAVLYKLYHCFINEFVGGIPIYVWYIYCTSVD